MQFYLLSTHFLPQDSLGLSTAKIFRYMRLLAKLSSYTLFIRNRISYKYQIVIARF